MKLCAYKLVGLNRAEALFVRGVYGGTPELPSRIGYEAAGVVEEVGPGVDASWIGKKVATIPGFSMSTNGALGEEKQLCPASSLGEYPAKLSPLEAAAIWMQYLTAYGALITFGGMQRGDFVLITAASSSVGLGGPSRWPTPRAYIPITATRKAKQARRIDFASGLPAYVVVTEEEEDLREASDGNHRQQWSAHYLRSCR